MLLCPALFTSRHINEHADTCFIAFDRKQASSVKLMLDHAHPTPHHAMLHSANCATVVNYLPHTPTPSEKINQMMRYCPTDRARHTSRTIFTAKPISTPNHGQHLCQSYRVFVAWFASLTAAATRSNTRCRGMPDGFMHHLLLMSVRLREYESDGG